MSEAGLRDLAWIVDKLDAMGRLARVKSVVDPDFELAGIAARFEGGPFAVLFENVKGKDNFITEVSMDETDMPQTPLEMLFILAAQCWYLTL